MTEYNLQGNVQVAADGSIHCQHGAPECEVNTLLQCALSIAAFTPAPAHAPPGQPPLTQSLLDCFYSQELSLHGRYPEVKSAANSCISSAGAIPRSISLGRQPETCLHENITIYIHIMVSPKSSSDCGFAQTIPSWASADSGFVMYASTQ